MKRELLITVLFFFIAVFGINSQVDCECESDQMIDRSRGDCNETLSFSPTFNMTVSGGLRTISANSIPDHKVGLFGRVPGSLNPNAISAQSLTYQITAEPEIAAILTPLLSTTGSRRNVGPQFSFGILLNGVELDPVAAEPFPHQGMMDPNANWEWNLEALNVRIGLDCNNAHVQPTGKYHYHGQPTLYLVNENIPADEMTLVGYAADGFPIYYKYAYLEAMNGSSTIVEMTSSYRLKEGCRPGDGITAPCDNYNGVYSNDYEYIEGLGTLDEANGRIGITPDYPESIYYYVITDDFPGIPRYFRGTPTTDLAIGPPSNGVCSGINGGDNDNDGICKIDDCNDYDASIGAKQIPGTACDDGDPTTKDDVIQSNGCACAGTKVTTAQDNTSISNVHIYPNPVSSVLIIDVDENVNLEMKLSNLNGKLIYSQKNMKAIDVQQYANGIYILEIQNLSNGHRLIKTIVVNK